jgi:hypothetical protein
MFDENRVKKSRDTVPLSKVWVGLDLEGQSAGSRYTSALSSLPIPEPAAFLTDNTVRNLQHDKAGLKPYMLLHNSEG